MQGAKDLLGEGAVRPHRVVRVPTLKGREPCFERWKAGDFINFDPLPQIGKMKATKYLYPLPSDPVAVPTDRPFGLALEVTPPFGADHIVAVSAQSSLDALNAELRRLDGRPNARRAAALIAAAAARARGWWSGVQGLFTVP